MQTAFLALAVGNFSLLAAILVLGFLVSFVSIASIAAQSQGVFGPDTPVGWLN
jgi:uncharacterized membrane protein